MYRWVSLVAKTLILLAVAHHAQAEQRYALVVTNQAYSKEFGQLANTHEDGRLLAAALRQVGFKVQIVQDADKDKFRLEIGAYVGRLAQAGADAVGFFYYSGHGAAQSKYGDNYLIPTNARLAHSAQLPLLGLKLGEIIESISAVRAKANFVVVDAGVTPALRLFS